MAEKPPGSLLAFDTQIGERPFSPEELRACVVGARTAYAVYGGPCSVPDLKPYVDLPLHKIAKIVSHSDFEAHLLKHRISWKTNPSLTVQQNYLLMVLSDPHDRRSLPARLKQAGLSTAQYRQMMRNPNFSAAINKLVSREMENHEHVADMSLMAQVQNGNMKAIEYYNEMTGRFTPGQGGKERDLQAVVSGILEIIMRHVVDQKQLGLIADDIQNLMGGAPAPRGAIEETKIYRSEKIPDYLQSDEPIPMALDEPRTEPLDFAPVAEFKI